MTAIIPYGSISLDASPSVAVGNFTDTESIAAETVRVYNTGSVEVFVGFGKSTGGGASVSVPTRNETNGSFSIPPKESEVLYKGSGNDQIAVITSGGLSAVRFTAVKLQNSGGEIMGSLELISVLKDAMGSQKTINAAAEKIATAHNISEAKRKEADQAAKIIAEAKVASAALEKEKKEHLQAVSLHRSNIITFNSQAEDVRKNIETEQAISKADIDSQYAALAKEKLEVQTLRDEAAKRENSAIAKEKSNSAAESILVRDRASLEEEKQFLIDAKANHDDNVEKLVKRQKKLDDAIKGV